MVQKYPGRGPPTVRFLRADDLTTSRRRQKNYLAGYIAIFESISNILDKNRLKNWRYYTQNKKPEDRPFFPILVNEYQNAGIGFEDIIEMTKKPGFPPLIYARKKNRSATRMLSS